MDIETEHFEPARTYVPTKSSYADQRYASLVRSYQAAVDREEAQLSKLRTTLEARTERVLKLEEDRDKLRQTVDSERTNAKERLARVSSSLEARTERVANLEVDRDNLRDRVALLTDQISALRDDANARSKRIKTLEEEREVLRRRVVDLRDRAHEEAHVF